jgi:ABC-type transport system involved in multi-copper enzyme maturation permease subunit
MLTENPVLQRELIVNLRTPRAFVLMLAYQVALAAVVLIAYPQDARIDLSQESASAQKLVDFFFLGQFVLVSLMAPSFAAGSITGEKERKTYEMLLASPLRPSRIVVGKMVASLTHLLVLIVGSLPIIMLCLPLGGVSIYELLAAYLALVVSIILFGAIAVFCSSRFKRTSASLVVSYLFILPLVIVGAVLWRSLAPYGNVRILASTVAVPVIGLSVTWVLLYITSRRLLYPPDVGSQGNEVVDLDKERDETVGMVIQRDQFPDNLFAPPRRKTLMADGANPVYDKELHAELFSQGTLMLRLVIQISMMLALVLMAAFLFIWPHLTGWYFGYVIVFNMLVAPVFLSGAISSERERQTLDLLLTTLLSPWQILFGKAAAGYRVSGVLTLFLTFPVFLAIVLNGELTRNLSSVVTFMGVAVLATLFNAALALLCSVSFRKTATAMMATYATLIVLYFLPLSIYYLVSSFALDPAQANSVAWLGIASPFMAIGSVPWDNSFVQDRFANEADASFATSWSFAITHVITLSILIAMMVGGMIGMFSRRWRIVER